ncbi:bifunctional protein tyrosine phosphatase family protein/NAD(P)/FAD-dependent oxidoreductase [Stutzerimonas frequens]|uniref:bifunctional protein tyrosine phosphatase family protein/NAD(P)/FAD-dependent oxidoreductase n=1 Tax=Stutzerimonas frequens TaxID=2968969 RepID=UPI00190CB9E3|nr:bifunctional protein tyrosine phosphatase family protein/NAD(P)/FAD-dependent oxidoreductase [Stutzerimonas frequens]MBK3871191.1 TIGR01244 family phosphatase [Stutzerimonas frequens]MBK3909528.1 TIGR01244 family phosphatase [Stutzerimonas frequens]MBK3928899.1 TIGR01244 family phosphatase [Stutzerimonas frequens]
MQTIKRLTPFLSVAAQLQPTDMALLAGSGFRCVINNRPDNEGEGQPSSEAIRQAAEASGLEYHHLPVISGQIGDADVAAFRALLGRIKGPALAFCRTGTRSASLWALAEAHHLDPQVLLQTARQADYDLSGLLPRLEQYWQSTADEPLNTSSRLAATPRYDVLVIGGGAAGCAVTASLLKRDPNLRVAVIEPREQHYYQPGWTLVGAGVFDRANTERAMSRCIPSKAQWIHAAAEAFEPEHQQVVLEDGSRIGYRALVVCPGLALDWDAIEGARDSLGKYGVTSNYAFELAPYTWQLVQQLRHGRALFTQPPMPIKCAGAPQKAMYLSCDHWLRQGVLKDIQVDFCSAGAVLFGVADFVPGLMAYVERYGAELSFNNRLTAVDGPARKAWFDVVDGDGQSRRVVREFDMLHLVPPQHAPEFIRQSALSTADGWFEAEHETLRHPRFGNIFSLGDVCSAPNAKTAAAVRKQAPVVAENVLSVLGGAGPRAIYDGYGSCPLTVERGKVILAEFGYGGKLLPTFPLDPKVPRRLAWKLKTRWMPSIYFDMMLKGHEWLAEPKHLDFEPRPAEAPNACDFGQEKKG